MERFAYIFCVLLALAAPVVAGPPPKTEDDFGTLNPDDTGREMLIRKIEMGARDTVTCSLAFNSTKYDDHTRARYVARVCAEAGNTKAMTWMSHFATNGIGGAPDPEAAAMWDRRAAQAGDPVGKFNYGVDLIRGRGVAQNSDLGRALVDEAAKLGLEIAQRLVAANYDLDVVTPDAEN